MIPKTSSYIPNYRDERGLISRLTRDNKERERERTYDVENAREFRRYRDNVNKFTSNRVRGMRDYTVSLYIARQTRHAFVCACVAIGYHERRIRMVQYPGD